MKQREITNPIWAYIVLIGGGIFAFSTLPGMLLVMTVPFWKHDEISFFSVLFMVIGLFVIVVIGWGMRKAFVAIKTYRQWSKTTGPVVSGGEISTAATENTGEKSAEVLDNGLEKKKKPIWPWIALAPGALLLATSGPGVLMLPIMPLFMAGMSTDSGNTPGYVPGLIILVGYGLLIGYIILVVKAIKTLRAR
ncbi:hypothetical protein QE429_001027 [Bacillus sp. SORGH_AS 510]|uniref:hypothetical protein n=1 Tax=Bacillus sp. SORGH_AS_0510 TaxID=3041771 RepID=UPI00278B47E2|nr:hypothetical protein [Bacillus sp. SORGH_AS_0510]MDQ1144200.1 hypothetical protein [Bacillus sp. SORGH_AS_0510]